MGDNPLGKVDYFAYQIQDQAEDGNIEKLAESHYDLLIIDQTRSIKEEEEYDSKADVSLLKRSENSKGGEKIVLCYIDVGEAESYRWYWQDGWRIGSPEWIVAEDPDGWDENYPVKFWRDQWKEIINRYVERIIDDGYDGIYLDWLEVYSFEPVAEAASEEGLDPRRELLDFAQEIARHARGLDPDFLLVAQNAAELGSMPEYVDFFDAIAQEAIRYDGGGDPDTEELPGDVPVDPRYSRELVEDLRLWLESGKPVFDIEYAKEAQDVSRAYRMGAQDGYKVYVTLRPLDTLTGTPPPGYWYPAP